jgi:hypothetical protein
MRIDFDGPKSIGVEAISRSSQELAKNYRGEPNVCVRTLLRREISSQRLEFVFPRSHILDFRFAAVVLRCADYNFKVKCEGFSDRSPALENRKERAEILSNLSFKISLRAPTQGCIHTDQRIESVGLFLASFAGTKGIAGTSGTVDEKGKPLEKQKIAVS